jgi:sugar phosphate isomerase/epimerase
MKHFASLLIALFAIFAALPLFAQDSADCYKDVRIKKFKIAMQIYTFRKFTFAEALEKTNALGIRYVEAYPGQRLSKDLPEKAVFDHNMTDEQIAWVKKELQKNSLTLVAYGVVSFDSTEKSMRQVFDFARKMGIQVINTEPAFTDWHPLDKMVQEYDIKISVHNHPLPSHFALPQTVLKQVKGLDRRIGSGMDTGHWMRSGVEPLKAMAMLRGRIVHSHLKDLDLFNDPKKAKDVPFGTGKANIHDILAELTLQDYDGYLSIEHEREDESANPSPNIAKGLDYLKSITYFQDYDQLLPRWRDNYSIHGWNHYGPGYFLLDEKTGVLTGQGGMGLLWYSARKYKDFILELDYKCSEVFSNSGVFLRVPEMVTSDDYIYKSFEIQIDDASTGIHNTGAVYDAVAPSVQAFNETGQWNHYKISFIGSQITVELNGIKVVDWAAKPSGKIGAFAADGYLGLQNHDSRAPVQFKNVFVKEL